MGRQTENQVYNRQNQKLISEPQYQEKLLRFLYQTVIGRILLKSVVTTPLFSKYYARQVTSQQSVKNIQPFIDKYDLSMDDYQETDYASFDAFFTRKLKENKRRIDQTKSHLVAPADSRLLAYEIDKDLSFKIKNSHYSLTSILKDPHLAAEYEGGNCLVFRLSVTDYHRYIFFDQGVQTKQYDLPGRLHTVSPIALERYPVYAENTRVCSVLETASFGKVIQVEVGALLVGRINNHPKTHFDRGEEKGYFSYGGSTIVLLFKKNQIKLDQDLAAYANKGIECAVKLGEKIGVTQND